MVPSGLGVFEVAQIHEYVSKALEFVNWIRDEVTSPRQIDIARYLSVHQILIFCGHQVLNQLSLSSLSAESISSISVSIDPRLRSYLSSSYAVIRRALRFLSKCVAYISSSQEPTDPLSASSLSSSSGGFVLDDQYNSGPVLTDSYSSSSLLVPSISAESTPVRGNASFMTEEQERQIDKEEESLIDEIIDDFDPDLETETEVVEETIELVTEEELIEGHESPDEMEVVEETIEIEEEIDDGSASGGKRKVKKEKKVIVRKKPVLKAIAQRSPVAKSLAQKQVDEALERSRQIEADLFDL